MYIKYFLIPIFDSLISIKDYDRSFISLGKYVAKYYPRLKKLEDRRVEIIWSNGDSPLTNQQKRSISLVETSKKELANEINIPLYILAVLDYDGKVYEYSTKQEIYYDYGFMLGVRECSKSVFVEKYTSAYESRVQNFFNRKNFKIIKFPEQKVLRK